MKFDIARAWKDENYRQTLSEEQLEMLPANPAGELDEAALAEVCGGDGYGGFGALGASSSSAAFVKRNHSFALICDLSIYSVNLLTIPVIPIASPTSQCCVSND